jgi:hypothetical protein
VITAETVAGALLTSERRIRLGGGWFSNGYFALRDEALAAAATDEKPSPLAAWAKHERIPVVENSALRIPRRAESQRCQECIDGVCECHCGDEHVCKACEGAGTAVIETDIGQMVFEGMGETTVVQPLLGALLEGLTVVRCPEKDQPANLAMLCGLDEAGEMVVVVMPLRESLRNPLGVTK